LERAVSATCVAEAARRAYLVSGAIALAAMTRPSMQQQPSSPIALPRPMVAVAALVAVLIAGTILLWAHYGTAVFYEMIAAGIASCL
jgi:hypothetical protein